MATENEKEVMSPVPVPVPQFPPSVWGSSFASLPSQHSEFEAYTKDVEVLKEEVKHMLMQSATNVTANIEFINLLCRLGLSYHFKSEIDNQLNHLFNTFQNDLLQNDDLDLYTLALLFRVLRQYGYRIPSDVFKKFKDNNGGFNKGIADDVKGLLSLYEACFLCVHDEDLLDEALDFTKKRLEILIEKLNNPNLVEHIRKSLARPLHHGVERVEALNFISYYEEQETRNETLLTFAKLDYNRLQLLYREELALLSRWWQDSTLTEKLPYIRDRIVECYFWIFGSLCEPQYSYARLIGSKHAKLVSIVDDTYDSHGILEELNPFTVAIQSCAPDAMDQLSSPNYMKVAYKAFSDLFGETENHKNEGIRYRTAYAKERFQELARSYFVEAQWLFDDEYVPSFEEYMKIGLITSAMDLISAVTMIGVEELGSKDYDFMRTNPKIFQATNYIVRFMNDVVPHEVEYKYKKIPKGLQSYMNEYGVSKEEAIERIRKMCANAWKDINEAFMKPTAGSQLILRNFLNNARVANFLYTSSDIYTYPSDLKNVIASLFINPLPL